MTLGLDWDTLTGRLVIAGVDMHGPGWCMGDLTALWGEVDVRGDNQIMDGAPGRAANSQLLDETQHMLGLTICGETNQDGEPYDDPWVGLELNIADLRDQVLDPPTSTKTRPAVLHMPSGATRSADIQAFDLRLGDALGGYSLRSGQPTAAHLATFQLRIPAGRFT